MAGVAIKPNKVESDKHACLNASASAICLIGHDHSLIVSENHRASLVRLPPQMKR